MAITNARGWAGVLNMFRGEAQSPVQAYELLPFPDLVQASADRRRVSKRTAIIFHRLMNDRKIPPAMIGACAGLLEEINELRKGR